MINMTILNRTGPPTQLESNLKLLCAALSVVHIERFAFEPVDCISLTYTYIYMAKHAR